MDDNTPHLDVIGIGALNIDYILTKDMSRHVDIKHIFGDDFELGSTKRTEDPRKIEFWISDIGLKNFKVFHAGSAFNTLHAISKANTGLRLGFVGVGGAPENGIDFKAFTASLGIDNRYIYIENDQSYGKCLSVLSDERNLLVYGGANTRLGDHLEKHADELIDYLSKAKWVHFTSFFGRPTPEILYTLLVEARKRNPTLKISFDPGHFYTERLSPVVLPLFSVVDYLFLNEVEFRNLGATANREDYTTAKRIFQLTGPALQLILTKKYNSIQAFHKFGEDILLKEYSNQRVSSLLVKDDTGAGDVFTAGVIIAKLLPILSDDLGPAFQLANKLVREKLKEFGHTNYGNFASILQEYIREHYKRKYITFNEWFGDNRWQILKYVAAFLLGVVTNLLANILTNNFFK